MQTYQQDNVGDHGERWGKGVSYLARKGKILQNVSSPQRSEAVQELECSTWIKDISGYGSALVQCCVNDRLNGGKQMYVGRSGARRGEEYDDARDPLRGGPMRVPPVLFLPCKCQMPAETWNAMERWTRRQSSVHQQSLSGTILGRFLKWWGVQWKGRRDKCCCESQVQLGMAHTISTAHFRNCDDYWHEIRVWRRQYSRKRIVCSELLFQKVLQKQLGALKNLYFI